MRKKEVFSFDQDVYVHPDSNTIDRMQRAINAAWNFFPLSIADLPPKGLVEAHYNFNRGTVVKLRVSVDRNGNMSAKLK